MPPGPLALADLHLDLLYERDQSGLLLRSRDPQVIAPFFHLVRTMEGNRWLLSAAASQQRRAELQEAFASEPVIRNLGELESSPPILNGIQRLLPRERASARETRGPAFLFPDPLPSITGTAELLRDPRSAQTVPELAWIRTATSVQHPLSVARNSRGEVVSVCHSARATPVAAEAGVETARAYRGRGLAGAVVVGWAAAVKAEGRMPLYSTQWTNGASRSVARKLGLVLFGEDCQIG